MLVPEKLYFGMDGLGVETSIQFLSRSHNHFLGLTCNPLQGLGSLYTLNVNLIPTFGAYNLFGAPGSYLLVALELFAATFFLGKEFGFTPITRRIGGYTICLFSLPYFDQWQIYPVFNLAPNIAECLAATTFAAASVGYSFRASGIRRLFGFFCGTVCVLWILASQPTYILIFAPTLATLCISLWYINRSRKSTHVVAVIWIALVAVFSVMIGWEYISGIFFFTASNFFTQELNTLSKPTLYAVSIAFQSDAHGKAGALLVVMAMLGATRFILFRPFGTQLWALALPFVPLTACSLIYMGKSSGWPYPLPVYFEFSLWPLYTLLAASLIDSVTNYFPSNDVEIGMRDESSSRFLSKTRTFLRRREGVLLIIFLVAISGVIVQPRVSTGDILGRLPSKTPIVSSMSDMIALTGGKDFSGYAANFYTPDVVKSGLSWGKIVNGDLAIARQTGNSHRMMGLWAFAIPTIEEYQPITNPYLYALSTRVLSNTNDIQTRNITLLTRIRPNVLRMLGVRLIITGDMVNAAHAIKIMNLSNGRRLVLSEFDDVNLGNYNPVHVKTVSSASKALDALDNPEINFRNMAVTFEHIDVPLTNAEQIHFRVESDKYTVRAHTDGTSLIVLPVQFSNCLKVDSRGSNTVRLIRTNFLLTGVLFKGDLDIDLSKRTLLFDDPGCRKRDYIEAKSIKLNGLNSK